MSKLVLQESSRAIVEEKLHELNTGLIKPSYHRWLTPIIDEVPEIITKPGCISATLNMHAIYFKKVDGVWQLDTEIEYVS